MGWISVAMVRWRRPLLDLGFRSVTFFQVLVHQVFEASAAASTMFSRHFLADFDQVQRDVPWVNFMPGKLRPR